MRFDDPVLECQTCGEVLRHLSTAEAQHVADDPHAFIVDCRSCRQHIMRELTRNCQRSAVDCRP